MSRIVLVGACCAQEPCPEGRLYHEDLVAKQRLHLHHNRRCACASTGPRPSARTACPANSSSTRLRPASVLLGRRLRPAAKLAPHTTLSSRRTATQRHQRLLRALLRHVATGAAEICPSLHLHRLVSFHIQVVVACVSFGSVKTVDYVIVLVDGLRGPRGCVLSDAKCAGLGPESLRYRDEAQTFR
eukprot:2948759-Pleurochrysis_carterae.AAC.1